MRLNLKNLFRGLVAAALLAGSSLLISSSSPAPAKASALSTCEIQILDSNGNELTDPNARPTLSGGTASVTVEQKSFYRMKFINCGTLPCGTTSRLYGFVVNDSNFTTNYGVTSGASGAYLNTNYSNDPNSTVTMTVWGFRS